MALPTLDFCPVMILLADFRLPELEGDDALQLFEAAQLAAPCHGSQRVGGRDVPGLPARVLGSASGPDQGSSSHTRWPWLPVHSPRQG